MKSKYTPLLKTGDGKYAPTVKGKVPRERVKIWWASDRSEARVEDVTASCNVSPIVKLGNVWMMGGGRGFGVTLNLSLALIEPTASLDIDAFA